MWLTPALPPKGGRSDLGHDLYAMVTSFTALHMPWVVRFVHTNRTAHAELRQVQRYESSLSGSPEKLLTDLPPHRGVGVDDRF